MSDAQDGSPPVEGPAIPAIDRFMMADPFFHQKVATMQQWHMRYGLGVASGEGRGLPPPPAVDPRPPPPS